MQKLCFDKNTNTAPQPMNYSSAPDENFSRRLLLYEWPKYNMTFEIILNIPAVPFEDLAARFYVKLERSWNSPQGEVPV